MTRGRLGLGVWSRDVAAILDAEGRERAWLAGHSLGAQIALRFAADHPRRCAGLVLVDPVFESALTGRRRALARHRWLVAAAAAVVRVANRAGIRRRRFPSRDLRELDRETRAALRDADSREEIVRRYSALGPILSHMPTANYLAQLLATVAPVPPPADPGLPVLVVVSTGGRFADNAAKQAELERFPGAVMAAVDCEHWPLTERPDEVRRAIDDFLFSRVAPGCGKLAAVWETRSTGDSE